MCSLPVAGKGVWVRSTIENRANKTTVTVYTFLRGGAIRIGMARRDRLVGVFGRLQPAGYRGGADNFS
jgi:hypothetical protein